MAEVTMRDGPDDDRRTREMKSRTIGNDTVGHVEVGAIGMGAMAFLWPAERPGDQVRDTMRAALDAGVTFIDTADGYGLDSAGAAAMGQNERLVAELLDELGTKQHVFIATKGGHTRQDGGGWGIDGRPEYLKQAVDRSLTALGVDRIDLYQHHRPDPAVDYTDTLQALREIHDAGKVRMLGISNADCVQIRTAHDVLGDALVSVQNQYSPAFRSSRVELDLCDELGLAFLPWSPLGGIGNSDDLAATAPAFGAIADELGVSPQRVTLAWMLATSPVVIPIPGASRPASIVDSAAAADLDLSADQLARLNA